MKINRNITKIGVLALAILAASVACKSPVQPGGASCKLAALSVAVGGPQTGQKTLLPAALLPSALTYDLTLTRSGYTTVTKTSLAYDAIAAADLEPGAWSLALTAYLGTDAVFGATQDVTLGAGPNAVAVLLDPLQPGSGAGSFTYELNLPAGSAYNAQVYLSKVKADIQSSDAGVLALIDKTASAGVTNDLANAVTPKLSFNMTALESGIYYLRIDLRKGAVLNTALKATKHLQLVYIYNNRVSTAPAVTLTDAELGSAPAVPSGLVFSVSGSTVTLAWTDNSNTEEKFYVYRDGTKVYEVIGGTSGFSYVDAAAGSGGASDAHTYEVSAWNEFGESARASGAWQGSGTVTVSISLANKVITFTPATVSAVQGTALSVTTNAGAGFSGWKWYRDGILDALNTTSVYTWTPGVADIGTHTLSVSVLYDGVAFSGDLPVTVSTAASVQYSLAYSNRGADGGTAPVDATVYTSAQSATVLGNTGNLTKSKGGVPSEFFRWNTALDGSGANYMPGGTIPMTANVTLYPQWFEVGARGPAGGYIFYNQGDVINGWRYLEAAPTDQSTGAPWSLGFLVLGEVNGIGNGVGIANTNSIIRTVGNTGTYAAKLCADLTVAGYSDWYLPTVLELQQMNLNLHHAGLGGFVDDQYYWSSLYGYSGPDQNSLNYHFFAGDTPTGNGSPQTQNFYVRAVRAFKSANPTYAVTYIGNGATGGTAPIDTAGYEAGDTVTVKLNLGNLVKNTTTCYMWNTKADGTGISYVAGSGTFTMPADNITLYAQWGNLYVTGSSVAGKAGYWQNGIWNTLVSPRPTAFALAIRESGANIFIMGNYHDDWHGKGIYWTDGAVTTVDDSNSFFHAATTAFDVYAGNVYSLARATNDTQTLYGMPYWMGTTFGANFAVSIPAASPFPTPLAAVKTATELWVGGYVANKADSDAGTNLQAFVRSLTGSQIILSGGTAVYSLAVSGSNIYAVGTNGGTQAVLWTSTNGGTSFSVATELWSGSGKCAATKILLDGPDIYIVGTDGTNAIYKKNAEAARILSGGAMASSIAVYNGNVFACGSDDTTFMPTLGYWNACASRKALLWVNGSLVSLSSHATVATMATDIIYVP